MSSEGLAILVGPPCPFFYREVYVCVLSLSRRSQTVAIERYGKDLNWTCRAWFGFKLGVL